MKQTSGSQRGDGTEPTQARSESGANAGWDVVVVGGGPSGMIAAGRAAEGGCRVLLLEKNERLGEKLLITGGGRCNITNAVGDRHTLTARYGQQGKHLHSIFARFTPEDMRAFLRRFGLETRVEAENRVFPVTDDASSVREVLIRYMAAGGVTVRTGSPVERIIADESGIRGVRLDNGETVSGNDYVIAPGGTARPETGSTGDGFAWLRELGLPVRENDSALVPLIVPDSWVRALQGLTVDDARLHVELLEARVHGNRESREAGGSEESAGHPEPAAHQDSAANQAPAANQERAANQAPAANPAANPAPAANPEPAGSANHDPASAAAISVYNRSLWGNARRTMSRRGKLLFTHFGLSGPLALNAAEEIQLRAQEGPIRLVIDLLPGVDHEQIDAMLRDAAETQGKRTIRRVLERLVAKRVTRALCETAEVDPGTPAARLGKAQRRRIVERSKGMPCRFDGLMGPDKAIISSGGLDPRVVDFRTMRLHAYPELCVLGDMLDFNRPSGGYSLQICWASGWVAGDSCAERCRDAVK